MIRGLYLNELAIRSWWMNIKVHCTYRDVDGPIYVSLGSAHPEKEGGYKCANINYLQRNGQHIGNHSNQFATIKLLRIHFPDATLASDIIAVQINKAIYQISEWTLRLMLPTPDQIESPWLPAMERSTCTTALIPSLLAIYKTELVADNNQVLLANRMHRVQGEYVYSADCPSIHQDYKRGTLFNCWMVHAAIPLYCWSCLQDQNWLCYCKCGI